MIKKRGKQGQLHLSFGVIFSIILIIVFLGFGFYAITKFIQLQEGIQTEKFMRDFQDDIDAMWKSSQGSQIKSYVLPKKVTAVCFTDDENELWNFVFQSKQIIQGKNIENIALDNILAQENPYCILNVKGKVNLKLSKEFGETRVMVEREE